MGVIKGDTRSLDYCSLGEVNSLGFLGDCKELT